MNDAAGTSRILTLVFTDLADSTALKTQRGDRAVGELIARHRAHVRRLATEAGGRVVDWAGDGCFLTFDTPSAAVLFALRLQRAHGEEPDLPGVRTGIHMGEVSERPGPDGDPAHPRVEGLAVDLAARISGLARPGQVLMSSAVADSARQRLDSDALGRPMLWRAHGSYSLKGFDEALEIREAGLEGVASFEAPGVSESVAVPPRVRLRFVGRRPLLPALCAARARTGPSASNGCKPGKLHWSVAFPDVDRAARLHAQAPRREDPAIEVRPRRRAQAGDGPLRRREGFNGPRREDRSRGLVPPHGPLLPDPLRRGPSLRGDGRQLHGRRHHGDLRRPDSALGAGNLSETQVCTDTKKCMLGAVNVRNEACTNYFVRVVVHTTAGPVDAGIQ